MIIDYIYFLLYGSVGQPSVDRKKQLMI